MSANLSTKHKLNADWQWCQFTEYLLSNLLAICRQIANTLLTGYLSYHLGWERISSAFTLGPKVPRPEWYHERDNVRVTASNRSRPIFEGGRRLTFRKCFFSSLSPLRAGLLSSSFGWKKKRSDVPVKVASWLLRSAVTPSPPSPTIFPNLSPPTSSLRSTCYPVFLASIFHPSPIQRTRFLQFLSFKITQTFLH